MIKDSDIIEYVAEWLAEYDREHLSTKSVSMRYAQQIDQLYRKHYRERLVGAYDEYLHKCGIMRVLPDQNRVRELIKQELSDE